MSTTLPHLAPLAVHVNRIRADRGADRVPDFDPADAGVRARILLLLEAPGPKATPARGGSGFVSADNASGTSANLRQLLQEAAIDRARELAIWNIVPWYVGDDRRIRGVTTRDLQTGRPYVEELLTLLTDLRVVVLLGRSAARGWRAIGAPTPAIEAPHPSPTNLNARPHCRAEILEALRAAKTLSA